MSNHSHWGVHRQQLSHVWQHDCWFTLFASPIEEIERISYVPKTSRITLPSHLVTLEDSKSFHRLRLLHCFLYELSFCMIACDYQLVILLAMHDLISVFVMMITNCDRHSTHLITPRCRERCWPSNRGYLCMFYCVVCFCVFRRLPDNARLKITNSFWDLLSFACV